MRGATGCRIRAPLPQHLREDQLTMVGVIGIASFYQATRWETCTTRVATIEEQLDMTHEAKKQHEKTKKEYQSVVEYVP